ncbi:3-hydroxybenzoate 6-hydroxylase [Acrasis kona]|uniref:3-hydroxybenzoate 6-hydroxylase n=1 Tax=Acrasis kona TaxID=1008807 RepID=A0AAW2YW37_9EUKA
MNEHGQARRVLVVGGGVAGTTVSIFLKQLGYDPILFEKRSKMGDVGGSLNLAPNGLKAASFANLDGPLIDAGAEIDNWKFMTPSGEVLTDFPIANPVKERYGYTFVGVKRTKLLEVLHKAVEETNGIKLKLGYNLKQIKNTPTGVTAVFQNGEEFHGDLLIGADGLHSTTRYLLFGDNVATYTGLTQVIGIADIPKDIRGDPNTFLNVAGRGAHFITYPFNKNELCYGCTQRDEPASESWKEVDVDHAKNSLFAKWSPVSSIIENSTKVIKIGLYDRPSLKSWSKDRVLLIGDAAHATSPHLGQGANQALEDAYNLFCVLKRHSNVQEAFEEFYKIREPRTTALVTSARKYGEVRVCDDEQKCLERDEGYKQLFENGVNWEVFDKTYKI